MRRRREEGNGFENWGGYMEMKKQKLQEQFSKDAVNYVDKKGELFKSISVFVNGYTDPSADELRILMIQHGGTYHHYYRSGKTTHIIASNLPDCKIKQTQGIKFVKPSWIVDSIKENKLLDYRKYLLYSNQSKTQPSIKFLLSPEKVENPKPSVSKTASDKLFLTEFYSNSRLHHISTMGLIFKQYVNDLRSSKDHHFPGRDELKTRSNSFVYQHLEELHTYSKIIMHIDMDCFFVSVGIRNKPELKGIPVAVTHAKGNRSVPSGHVNKEVEACQDRGIFLEADNMNEMDSMSEIASCSYEARLTGIKNGMFLGQAFKLCPSLKPIPYDFESYKEVSFKLYNIVASYTLDIEAVSCDEMYVDCTELLQDTNLHPLQFAKILRDEVKEHTKCPCSVGFGGNRLQARIATKKAKPDGQFYLNEDPDIFFKMIPVKDLPGVGYSTSYKLKTIGINSCGDLQKLSLHKLQNEFGNKLGTTLYKFCRGIDDKDLVFNQVRKSVSADVNYGIRFQSDTERDVFLKQLSEEVSQRIQAIKMKGKCITLKLMVRSKDAPVETAKFLGHGICDTVTKSTSVVNAISDAASIYRVVSTIISKLNIDSKELRGIGIQLTRLESIIENKNNGLITFLETKNWQKGDEIKLNQRKENGFPSGRTTVPQKNINLSLSQVDQSFLRAMPKDIQEEIMMSLKESKKKVNNFFEKPDKLRDMNKSESGTVKEHHSNNKDTLDNYVSLGELKNLLEEWVCNEENPLSKDLKLISNYLKELITTHYLQELSVILKYLFRFIKYYDKPEEWRKAYFFILNQVQEKMVDIYKGNLAIEEEFVHF